MDYHLLSPKQQAEIRHRKLLELEAEHARLELELRLADAADIDNESVTDGYRQLGILVQQIATLASWLTPPPVETSQNGHRD